MKVIERRLFALLVFCFGILPTNYLHAACEDSPSGLSESGNPAGTALKRVVLGLGNMDSPNSVALHRLLGLYSKINLPMLGPRDIAFRIGLDRSGNYRLFLDYHFGRGPAARANASVPYFVQVCEFDGSSVRLNLVLDQEKYEQLKNAYQLGYMKPKFGITLKNKGGVIMIDNSSLGLPLPQGGTAGNF